MLSGLKDRVVIVTGGAHGIGKAYCRGLAEAAACVVIADIDKGGADALAAELGGVNVLPLHVDVSDENATKRMAAETLEHFSRIVFHIFAHFVFIVSEFTIKDNDWLPPFVGFVKVQVHPVFVVREHFAECGHAQSPFAGC